MKFIRWNAIGIPTANGAHVCESGRGNNPNRGAARPEGFGEWTGGNHSPQGRSSCISPSFGKSRLVSGWADSLRSEFPPSCPLIAEPKLLWPTPPRVMKDAVHVKRIGEFPAELSRRVRRLQTDGPNTLDIIFQGALR